MLYTYNTAHNQKLIIEPFIIRKKNTFSDICQECQLSRKTNLEQKLHRVHFTLTFGAEHKCMYKVRHQPSSTELLDRFTAQPGVGVAPLQLKTPVNVFLAAVLVCNNAHNPLLLHLLT